MKTRSLAAAFLLPLFLAWAPLAPAQPVPAQGSTPAMPPVPRSDPAEVGLSPERLDRVSTFIERLQAERKIAGAVTVVARHGKLARLEAQGFADLESERAMRPDDIFWIASMSKVPSNVGLLMLVEEGRILLSDPLEKFIPEFAHPTVAVARAEAPGGYDVVPAERSLTIHDLLIYRSGLPWDEGIAGDVYRELVDSIPEDATIGDWAAAVARVPLNFQPGAEWQYDYSSDVIGRVIEVVSGQPLDVYLHERVFAPLGMVDTGFSVPPEKQARLVSSYAQSADGPLRKVEHYGYDDPRMFRADGRPTRMFRAGGGLYSTAGDFLRFCQMLLNGGELDGRRLLGRKSIELMTACHSDPIPIPFLQGQYFGIGVAVQKNDGTSGLLSTPGTYGWSGHNNTYFRIDPREQLILLILVQQVPANNLEIQYGFHNAVMQAVVD